MIISSTQKNNKKTHYWARFFFLGSKFFEEVAGTNSSHGIFPILEKHRYLSQVILLTAQHDLMSEVPGRYPERTAVLKIMVLPHHDILSGKQFSEQWCCHIALLDAHFPWFTHIRRGTWTAAGLLWMIKCQLENMGLYMNFYKLFILSIRCTKCSTLLPLLEHEQWKCALRRNTYFLCCS